METHMKNTFGKTERGSVGGLESHPPAQTRTTSRHPPPMMRRSTARAHCHGATAAFFKNQPLLSGTVILPRGTQYYRVPHRVPMTLALGHCSGARGASWFAK